MIGMKSEERLMMISWKKVFVVSVYIVVSLLLSKFSWFIPYMLIGALLVWALVYGGSRYD